MISRRYVWHVSMLWLAITIAGCLEQPIPRADPLVKEADALALPADSKLIAPCIFNKKSRSRLYSCKYRSTAPFPKLSKHYANQLQEHGWVSKGGSSLKDWGRDFGGQYLVFYKGDFQLSFQFAGDRARYGWNYAISASVGVPPYECGKS